jgi:hypothetical protein
VGATGTRSSREWTGRHGPAPARGVWQAVLVAGMRGDRQRGWPGRGSSRSAPGRACAGRGARPAAAGAASKSNVGVGAVRLEGLPTVAARAAGRGGRDRRWCVRCDERGRAARIRAGAAPAADGLRSGWLAAVGHPGRPRSGESTPPRSTARSGCAAGPAAFGEVSLLLPRPAAAGYPGDGGATRVVELTSGLGSTVEITSVLDPPGAALPRDMAADLPRAWSARGCSRSSRRVCCIKPSQVILTGRFPARYLTGRPKATLGKRVSPVGGRGERFFPQDLRSRSHGIA